MSWDFLDYMLGDQASTLDGEYGFRLVYPP